MTPQETETLLREFIAALEELVAIYDEEMSNEETMLETAVDCDMVESADITTYFVRSKIIELKNKLLSLPL